MHVARGAEHSERFSGGVFLRLTSRMRTYRTTSRKTNGRNVREVWNSVYSRALARGETSEEAEASAFRQANGVIKKSGRESW